MLKLGPSEFSAVLAGLSNGCLVATRMFAGPGKTMMKGPGGECPLSVGANQDDIWEGGARVTQPVVDSFARNSFV